MAKDTGEVIQVEVTRAMLQKRLEHAKNLADLHAQEVKKIEGLLDALQQLSEIESSAMVGAATNSAAEGALLLPRPAKGKRQAAGAKGRGKRKPTVTIQAAVESVVASWNSGETMTAPEVTPILNEAYRGVLDVEVSQNQVSTVLRRMVGKDLKLVREGGPRRPAVYAQPSWSELEQGEGQLQKEGGQQN